MMPEHQEVQSEIYSEFNYITKQIPKIQGNVISEFPFTLPPTSNEHRFDEDGDLEIDRPQQEVIKIEHRSSTRIKLVGLQVWRGAFLLADLMIHMGLKGELKNCTALELGAGTGITSFVTSMFTKKVLCTDIDIGGILKLIKQNAQYNKHLLKSEFKVLPLDFMAAEWNQEILTELHGVDIILAADVIYDDDLTAAFISTLQKLLNTRPTKTVYLALEKRYVFTLENLDSVAPCYETFLSLIDKIKDDNADYSWKIEQLPLNFPQFFKYERVKELVLWKITSLYLK